MTNSTLRSLGLILWKNLLLRQRQCIATCMEIFVPIFILFMFAVLSWGNGGRDEKMSIEYIHQPAKLYEKLVLDKPDWCRIANEYNKKKFIPFTPNNRETTQIMDQVASVICNGQAGSLDLIPVENEKVMESNFSEVWRNNGDFLGAVVFQDGLKELEKDGARTLPYKIRLPRERFPDTAKLLPKNYEWKRGKYYGQVPGDFRTIGPNEDNEKKYTESGFIALQLSLDKVLAKTITGKDFAHTVALQAIPYPSYKLPDGKSFGRVGSSKRSFGRVIYVSLTTGLIFMIPSITKNVVSEKQTGISELLRLTGVSGWIQWLAWLIHAMTPQLITITLVSILSYVPIVPTIPLHVADPSLFWVILLLYVMASVALCLPICAIFRKPVIATTIAELLWIGSTVAGFMVDDVMFETSIALSVFPNVALSLLLRNVFEMETTVLDDSDEIAGARWSNLHVIIEDSERRVEKSVSNLHIMLMLLVDIAVYMILAIYLELVLPSEHGVRRPWYLFNFTRSVRQVSVTPAAEPPPNPGTGGTGIANPSIQAPVTITSFEPEPAGTLVGVDIQNLQKRFGRGKVAVGGVSLKMFSGDIFALLGHNGAGKTTLISMLTGFFAPSGGTAVINGYDIRRDLDKARQSMGLCPQHNMLFDNLTVTEQISLFGMLRGLSKEMAKAETSSLLAGMNLTDKSYVPAENLSGGQKRKLSLAMALIGGTKVVVLDEPTSGMDPQARREIWDLLLHLRGQRTILLTTHFMEEADVLGDRIGIMADGTLQCCGTNTFLKKYYGAGYTLKLTLHGSGGKSQEASTVSVPPPPPSTSEQGTTATPEVEATAARKIMAAAAPILETVQKHVPGAVHKRDARLDHASNEVFITLPAETATTSALSQLFVDLTARKDKLGIKTIGLSQTTMDEVFVRVGSLAHEQKYGGAATEDSEMDQLTFQRAPKQISCPCLGQFLSLLMKKMIWSMGKWIQLLFMTIIPFLLFMFAVMRISSSVERVERKEDDASHYYYGRSSLPVGRAGESAMTASPAASLEINLNGYESPVTMYSESGTMRHVAAVIGSSSKPSTNVIADLLKVGDADRIKYKRQHIVAAEVTSSDFIAMFNLYPYHSAPLAINLATNTLLKYLEPSTDHRIQVTNHPFNEWPKDYRGEDGRQSRASDYSKRRRECWRLNNNRFETNVSWMCKYIIPLGFIFLTANFVVNPIEENICKAKQLQLMTGASPLTYWGAAFFWDYLLYTLNVFLMIASLVVYEEMVVGYSALASGYGAPVLFLLLMVYGFSSIPFSYLVSLRSTSVAGGFSLITLVDLFLGILLGNMITNIDLGEEKDHSFGTAIKYVFSPIGRLFPTYSLASAMFFFSETSTMNAKCTLAACDPTECGNLIPYLTWYSVRDGYRVYDGRDLDKDKLRSINGMGVDVFFMIFLGLVFAGLLLSNEFKQLATKDMHRSTPNVSPPKESPPNESPPNESPPSESPPKESPQNIQDEDVLQEAERVNTLIASGAVGTECLVVQNLTKSFNGFAAVNQLSFGVHYGECFGLLGVNGAGKTTAFRMITGDEYPTMGNAFGFNMSLAEFPVKFLSNIGYCPQFDAILETFTGKQMLQLFAGLRGVPFKLRGSEAMTWLRRMGLAESANVRCGRYSGGMKRRLSTAMAMIGDPALILLDEPTSGVDPVSRRQFWKILDKLRESGQSIILTSHSMEECEALCSRLGIMVNGQFQCFGGVQHLKNKFAQGYSLTLKLKPELSYGSPELDVEIQKLEEKISERFQPCELKDKHHSLMQYHLKNPSISWDSLFKSMEEIKTEFSNLIEDYSVNETSLEEVFLAFARVQHPERFYEIETCSQVCTCKC